MEVFNLGQKIRVGHTYTNAAGVASDPDAVFVVVREPGSSATTYQYGVDAEVVRDDTGEYHIDLSLSIAGIWAVRGYSTGSVQAATADTLIRVKETITD